MAEQFWTKRAPTVAGFYWWRETIADNATVVQVTINGWLLRPGIGLSRDRTTEWGGEWWGPLQEPGGDAVENCQ